MAYEFFHDQALAYAFNFISLSVSYSNPYSKYIKPLVSLSIFFCLYSILHATMTVFVLQTPFLFFGWPSFTLSSGELSQAFPIWGRLP